ncbi:MAG: DUF2157 domain-containing protein [Bradyrhizobium sp.]
MLDRTYRQRLEADLTRWETDGVITPAVLAAIRAALPPLVPGINISVVLGIVGGLLIAAAFLAFVAAHWTELARVMRLAILFSGSIAAFGFGGWFARASRPVLADLCAAIGSIVFGAGIALVGQMYHLGEDFAAGMLLWTVGALAAAVLTGSRGALAVALAAASIWSCSRIFEARDGLHLTFPAIWLIGASLALAWNSRVAAHLVASAALPWWIAAALQPSLEPAFVLADGAALLFGAGLALAATPWQRVSSFGTVLSSYGAFSLAGAAILEVATVNEFFHGPSLAASQPMWAMLCGVAGTIFAFAAAATTRRVGAAFAGGAIGLVLAAATVWTPVKESEPWLAYAFELSAMLCLVVSGMLDAARPRIVAGWIGIAGVIAGITWAVKGSLLRRSVFLAVAGAAAIALATVLNRALPRSDT